VTKIKNSREMFLKRFERLRGKGEGRGLTIISFSGIGLPSI
jgi:hypothetical protein